MATQMQLRVVTVEFLRPGPPHNQLLSPLTQYLAICNNSGAGVVTVPYEQARFERQLKQLRYDTRESADRRAVLHEIGEAMGRLLGCVPGLPGALTVDPSQPGLMIHLRLTLSASELALLPFELAKVPIAQVSASDAWLAIQARPPVCITRNVRTVSPEGVVWPDQPRILFVAGDPSRVPFQEHKRALLDAIRPFQYPVRDDLRETPERSTAGELLTILVNPTLNDVLHECRRQRYTHLHILAHGDLDGHEFGLALRSTDDSIDVVSGERFANAITAVDETGVHRPSIVTLASCDGGNVGSLVLPGADLAHALHQAGIPLVVAAQFPLSMEGSVPLASTLYEGLLRGEHPLVLLQQLRAELHARYTTTYHDWASLVVYEALPRALSEQLESLRYQQAKRAMDAALQRVDRAVAASGTSQSAVRDAEQGAKDAIERLPHTGRFAVECLGLRGSARKRLAHAEHKRVLLSGAQGAAARQATHVYELLDQARLDYLEAQRRFVMNEAHPVRRVATLHWVAAQAVSLAVVLGKQDESTDTAWRVAWMAAELYTRHPELEEQAWAHGSLAELCLLRLAMPRPDEQARYDERALAEAQDIARLAPLFRDREAFPITSTARQIQRYVDWWASPQFAEGLRSPRVERTTWDGEHGLHRTAERVLEILGRWEPDANVPAPAESEASASPGDRAAAQGTLAASADRRAGPARRRSARSGQIFTVEMLPAGHGDALWIEYGDASAPHRVLVDCGTEATADVLLPKIDALPGREQFFDLFVMTHVDADHIGGALPLFKAVRRGLTFGDVWFNGWRHLSGTLGPRQGEMFTTAIEDFRLVWNAWQDGGPIAATESEVSEHELPGGLRLTLLSPTNTQLRRLAPVWARELRRSGLEPGGRVDYSRFLRGAPSVSSDVAELAESPFKPDAAPANGSSIALLAEFGGASLLLSGDAYAPVLEQSIRTLLRSRGEDRLRVDAFKLSHHGSQGNLSCSLLQLLDCPNYLISTNGDHFGHPDREAIARAVIYGRLGDRKSVLHFNYRTGFSEFWTSEELQEKHGYEARFPAEGEQGLKVSLLD
jgi:beta-lactamase superfamily II metal-dependent hydrolase